MGRSKFYALAGAAFIVLPSAAAFAADIPDIPAPKHFAGGWYLRGDIGFSNQQVGSLFNILYEDADTVTNVDKGFDSAPLGGIGIGLQLNDHLRVDVTGEYRAGASFHGLDLYTDADADPTEGTDDYTAVKTEWTFLANAYWDIGTFHGFTPFVGAGIGASYNTISDFRDVNVPAAGVAYADSASKWNLAWALYAGVGYQVTPNLTIEAAYRYINLGDAQSGDIVPYTGPNAVNNPMEFRDLTSHDFKVGFRWAFDAPQQSYYPPVVKY